MITRYHESDGDEKNEKYKRELRIEAKRRRKDFDTIKKE
jgi:hypothetical protein